MDEILNTSARLSKLTMEEKLPLKDIGNVAVPSPGGPTKLGSVSSPREEDKQRFNRLVTMAKKLVDEGHVPEALNMNKKALKIFNSERLTKKVAKMEAYLATKEEEEENSDLVTLGDGFCLPKDLYNKLYAHQKEGVLWMWAIHRKKKGGILGDDMGLGKTIQVISFLSGMFDLQKIKCVLIVMPVSLIPTWERELEKWDPNITVTQYHGSNKRNRERALTMVQRRGGICITTYGMVVSSWEDLSQREGREFTWDYVILDEGHKIKNPTKTSKGVHAIAARNRLIMTGTPIQNNLRELWALFDFVHNGTLLGTARTFKMEYDTPITRARERDATAGEKRLGLEMAESLKKIISPYFLRRTKADVKAKKKKESGDSKPEDDVDMKIVKMPTLMRKNDFIVWMYLTETQQKIYEDFLSLDNIKELLMTSRSPLVALTVLKKICDHPRLLTNHACAQLGLHMDGSHDENDELAGQTSAVSRIQHIPDATLINESGKLIILADLLDDLKANGHRCLVFSQSRKILDIIQKVMTNRGHRVMRLDGTIVLQDREDRINKFQSDPSYSIFLLTTQVGGVGLTLTAADRVVIFDPSWNPATDAQAVDRAFRIGQEKNVVIYRLITCGTVEEKIYRRQIFKDSINQQTTGNSKNPYRYFTKQELRELFELNTPRFSTTQKQLEEMHGLHRHSDPELDGHLAFLHSLDIFGLSDHDLMFSQEVDDEDDEDEENTAKMSNDYIQSRVQKAQELLSMESAMTGPERELAARQPGLSGAIHRDMQPRPGPAVKPDSLMKPKDIKSEIINSRPIFVEDEPMSRMSSSVIDLTDTPADHHSGRKPLDDFANMSIQDTDSALVAVKKENCVDLDSYDSPLKSFLGNDDREEFPKIEIDPGNIKSENVVADNSILTPHIKKTPSDYKSRRIVEEEILISPDGKSPVILTRPKRSFPFSPLTLNRKQPKSEDSGLAKNLYGKLIPSAGASPDGNTSLNDSSDTNTACDKLYMTFVEDTPESAKLPLSNHACSEIFVSDSPACVTRKSNIDISNSDVSERVVETPEYSENEERNNVGESVLETPEGGNDTKESISNSVVLSSDDEDDVIFTVKKRFASKARRLQLESSDEEDAVAASTDDEEQSPKIPEEKNDSHSIYEDSEQPIDKAKQLGFDGISPLENTENNDRNDTKSDNIFAEHKTSEDVIVNECVDSSVEIASNGDDNSNEAQDSGMDDLENSGIDDLENSLIESADDEEGEGEENFVVDDEDEENVEMTSEDDNDDGDSDEETESDEDDEPPEEFKEQYQQLILDARGLYKQKNFESALASILQAIEIHPSEFLQATALRIHQKMNDESAV